MDWKTLPGYDEKYASHSVKERKTIGGKVIRVLYGAVDAEGKPVTPSAKNDDGHGEWYGVEINGEERMFSWKHPASEGGAVEYGTSHEDHALEDMEADLKHKDELCHKAQELAENNASEEELKALEEEYNKIENWNTPKDAEWDEFFSRIMKNYQDRAAAYEENLAKKTELVKQAEELSTHTEWKATREKFYELNDAWRDLGSAGEKDKELRKAFNEARSTFEKNCDDYFANLDTVRAENKAKKEELIAKAKDAVATVTNYKSTSEVMNQLMDQWKAVKSAGHEVDEELWQQFNGARQEFFAKRKAFFAERDAERKAVIEKKRALIEEAKEIGEKKDFSKETTERMKQLDVEWRAAGFAGKETNDKLWEEFKAAKDVFWNGKHADSQERFKNLVDRKQDQIKKLRSEINTLEEKVYETDDFDEQRDLERRAENMKARVNDLKEDVEELNKKLDN